MMAGSSNESSLQDSKPSIVLDSLPYVDPELPEEFEQRALASIEEEMRRHSAPELPPLCALNLRTPIVKVEYEQAASGKQERFDFHIKTPDNVDDIKDQSALETVVKEAKIAFELERLRGMRLQIEKEAGAAQWKSWHESVLNPVLQLNQVAHSQQGLKVEQINARRQELQNTAGKRLRVMETQYQQLVHKKSQLEQAIAELEAELGR